MGNQEYLSTQREFYENRIAAFFVRNNACQWSWKIDTGTCSATNEGIAIT